MTDKRKALIIRLEPELHKQFKTICSFLGVRAQDVVSEMIEHYTDNNKKMLTDWAKEINNGQDR